MSSVHCPPPPPRTTQQHGIAVTFCVRGGRDILYEDSAMFHDKTIWKVAPVNILLFHDQMVEDCVIMLSIY